MIDVMDRHFQEELHLNLAQSAWVQFAHYLGYFLMAMPAGWLAVKLGYKGGIIAGLLLVAVGGFWFIPATHISAMVHEGTVSPNVAFVGFPRGESASSPPDSPFLETIANPYTTVLGPARYAAARVSTSRNRATASAGSSGPLSAAAVFLSSERCRRARAREARRSTSPTPPSEWWSCCSQRSSTSHGFPTSKRPTITPSTTPLPESSHSIWSHPHFVLGVVAQFLYVAAQAGVFSYFINYMIAEPPAMPESWSTGMTAFAGHMGPLREWLQGWFEPHAGFVSLSTKGAVEPRVRGVALLPDRPLHLAARDSGGDSPRIRWWGSTVL